MECPPTRHSPISEPRTKETDHFISDLAGTRMQPGQDLHEMMVPGVWIISKGRARAFAELPRDGKAIRNRSIALPPVFE
jgi:hypothetical protein